jgi:hypothetical protein
MVPTFEISWCVNAFMSRPTTCVSQAAGSRRGLHHVVRPRSAESEAEGWAVRLLLLQKLRLLRSVLNQLLKQLELRWYELQQLLHLPQLLLLENLQLL